MHKQILIVSSFMSLLLMGRANAQGCLSTAMVSKWPADQAVSALCPAGYAVNGIEYTHRFGENLTYQENVGLRCCPLPEELTGPAIIGSPWTNRWALSSCLQAPEGAILKGLSFEHARGHDHVYEENIQLLHTEPNPFIARIASCRNLPMRNKASLDLVVACASPHAFVSGIQLSHQRGQDLVYQENVGLTCCTLEGVSVELDPGERIGVGGREP